MGYIFCLLLQDQSHDDSSSSASAEKKKDKKSKKDRKHKKSKKDKPKKIKNKGKRKNNRLNKAETQEDLDKEQSRKVINTLNRKIKDATSKIESKEVSSLNELVRDALKKDLQAVVKKLTSARAAYRDGEYSEVVADMIDNIASAVAWLNIRDCTITGPTQIESDGCIGGYLDWQGNENG
eukprot:s1809_g5.t2